MKKSAYKGLKEQRGFTLIELLAVMAIMGILAGVVSGAIVGLGSRSQETRLDGDRDTMNKAANRFFIESFPEVYPVVSLANTDASIQVSPDLGVRLVNFSAKLAQDPTKKFVPDFLTELPDSSALVSWRIDTNSGSTFFASDGAPLIKQSNTSLDVDAATGDPGLKSDYEFLLTMNKDEAAVQILNVRIPAGYTLGGQFAAANSLMGVLSGTLATDNEVDSGNTIHFGGVVVSTGVANEWQLVINYNDNVSTSGSSDVAVKTSGDEVRVHTITITPPSGDSGGEFELVMDRSSDDPQNEATETWELTILSEATLNFSSTAFSTATGLATSARSLDTSAGYAVLPDGGTGATGDDITAVRIFTNPATEGVKRWLAEENTTIDLVIGDTAFFGDVPGSQGVLIK